ncbi:hypothetical protein [Streptomyces sp. NPDC056723]|uniref:hypothetical protein n=1 Tax=unclassified Streptomyces TaxID=2593676 RepID=UPI00368E0319
MAATETDPRRGEYVTYAPKGERCADCKQQIKSLERVWRVPVERPSGAPALGPYRHYETCP